MLDRARTRRDRAQLGALVAMMATPQQPVVGSVGYPGYPQVGYGYPQVGAATLSAVPPAQLMPPWLFGNPWGVVPEYPPGVAPGAPMVPPVAAGPCAPPPFCGPPLPQLCSPFGSPAMLARGMRAKQMKEVPQIAIGVRTSGVTTIPGIGGVNTATLTTQPTGRILCPTDFKVDEAIAQFFLITSIRASGKEYLAASGGIPATSFLSTVNRPTIEFPTVWPGVSIEVGVENKNGAPQPFFANFDAISIETPSCM